MRANRRVYVNLIVFGTAAFLLILLGARNLVVQQPTSGTIQARFSDASGLLPRNDVTMRGVVVGSVREVDLAEDGNVNVVMTLEPGVVVPEGTVAEIVRRSPIGELTLELLPGDGDPMPEGATIAVDDTIPPPDVSKTIEVIADVLHEVPSEDLSTVVAELADAVRGRGDDLSTFNQAVAELPEEILEVQVELEELITDGPKVTGVLADNADTLGDDLTQTKLLAQLLADRKHDLVDLYRYGGDFTTVAGSLIGDEKANLSCLVADFGRINSVMSTQENLTNLANTLDKNHFFFGAVEQMVQVGLDNGTWFRVQLIPPAQPHGETYAPHRPPPDVFPGNACRSRFGRGVDAVDQSDAPTLARDSSLRPGN
jgi:phospholipid/cholesterol/gamma-HCH transport system substrate-binding protein